MARSTVRLRQIAETLRGNGVDPVVLGQSYDSFDATGRLPFNMPGTFGQFENAIRAERQTDEIRKAKDLACGHAWPDRGVPRKTKAGRPDPRPHGRQQPVKVDHLSLPRYQERPKRDFLQRRHASNHSGRDRWHPACGTACRVEFDRSRCHGGRGERRMRGLRIGQRVQVTSPCSHAARF